MKSFSRILLVFLTFTFLYPATPDQEVQTEEAIRSFSEQLVLQMLEYRNEMFDCRCPPKAVPGTMIQFPGFIPFPSY